VSFSFDLDFDMTLKTLAPGESANGEIYFFAQMWSDSTNNLWSQEWELPKSVADGKDFEQSLTNTFSGTLFMENGETGHGSLVVRTYAEATSVVPVPAAVLLGFLGLSTAGVGLRKLA
jgi:hypothetical protein